MEGLEEFKRYFRSNTRSPGKVKGIRCISDLLSMLNEEASEIDEMEEDGDATE